MGPSTQPGKTLLSFRCCGDFCRDVKKCKRGLGVGILAVGRESGRSGAPELCFSPLSKLNVPNAKTPEGRRPEPNFQISLESRIAGWEFECDCGAMRQRVHSNLASERIRAAFPSRSGTGSWAMPQSAPRIVRSGISQGRCLFQMGGEGKCWTFETSPHVRKCDG